MSTISQVTIHRDTVDNVCIVALREENPFAVTHLFDDVAIANALRFARKYCADNEIETIHIVSSDGETEQIIWHDESPVFVRC